MSDQISIGRVKLEIVYAGHEVKRLNLNLDDVVNGDLDLTAGVRATLDEQIKDAQRYLERAAAFLSMVPDTAA